MLSATGKTVLPNLQRRVHVEWYHALAQTDILETHANTETACMGRGRVGVHAPRLARRNVLNIPVIAHPMTAYQQEVRGPAVDQRHNREREMARIVSVTRRKRCHAVNVWRRVRYITLCKATPLVASLVVSIESAAIQDRIENKLLY